MIFYPLQPSPFQVLHTSTVLVGELSDWIDVHPDFLEPVLQFLLKRLQHQNQTKLAGAAAEALQKICTTCSDHMGNHLAGINLVDPLY